MKNGGGFSTKVERKTMVLIFRWRYCRNWNVWRCICITYWTRVISIAIFVHGRVDGNGSINRWGVRWLLKLEGNLFIKKISRKAYLTEAPKRIKSKVCLGPSNDFDAPNSSIKKIGEKLSIMECNFLRISENCQRCCVSHLVSFFGVQQNKITWSTWIMNLSSATWTGFLKILQEQIQLHKKLKADEKTSDLRRWFFWSDWMMNPVILKHRFDDSKNSRFLYLKVEIFVRFPRCENIGLVWFLCFRWYCRICLCTWRRSFCGIAGLKEYLSVTGTANLVCLCCLPMKQLLYMMWSCHFGYPNIVCLGPLEMSSHKSCLQLLSLTQAM